MKKAKITVNIGIDWEKRKVLKAQAELVFGEPTDHLAMRMEGVEVEAEVNLIPVGDKQ